MRTPPSRILDYLPPEPFRSSRLMIPLARHRRAEPLWFTAFIGLGGLALICCLLFLCTFLSAVSYEFLSRLIRP